MFVLYNGNQQIFFAMVSIVFFFSMVSSLRIGIDLAISNFFKQFLHRTSLHFVKKIDRHKKPNEWHLSVRCSMSTNKLSQLIYFLKAGKQSSTAKKEEKCKKLNIGVTAWQQLWVSQNIRLNTSLFSASIFICRDFGFGLIQAVCITVNHKYITKCLVVF